MFDQIKPSANVIKVFAAVNYKFLWLAWVFVPDKSFQPGQIFAGKAGAYPSGAVSWFHSRVGSWAFPQTLSWKSLLGTSILGYDEIL